MKTDAIFKLLVIGILTNCSKNTKCKGEDRSSGIISNSINLDCEAISADKEFCIKADSVFKKVFPSNCNLPTINFSNYTLLGIYSEGQCNTKFERKVEPIEKDKKYQYTITVKDCGFCKKLEYSYNWVLVPKLPTNWKVEFKIIRK